MNKKWIMRMSVALLIGTAPIAVSVVPAAASAGSTPNGQSGACNMMVLGLGTGNTINTGMVDTAMSHISAQGMAGMFGAMARTC